MNTISEPKNTSYSQSFYERTNENLNQNSNDIQEGFSNLLKDTLSNEVRLSQRDIHYGVPERYAESTQNTRSTSSESPTVEEAKKLIMNYQARLVQEILYGTSNEEAKAKKKAKKYQLFRADNGVFGDKTLTDLVISRQEDTKTVTWNSSESKKLTEDQALYLKRLFHTSHLSGEEFGGLLEELIDQNILSREEAEKLLLEREAESKDSI